MDIMEAMQARHSVRQYLDKPIDADIREKLDAYVDACNQEGDLNMQAIYDEPSCFNSRMAHYGKFENVNNYIAVVGKRAPDLDERGGFFGEKVVLFAQQLGLNTCWVALTHGKSKASVASGEKEVIIIALGYGATQGSAHKSKAASDVSNAGANAPEWFKRGVEAALLAPTAINQQKFEFILDGNVVRTKIPRIGTQLKVDLGIVKCHFELGAGNENFTWG